MTLIGCAPVQLGLFVAAYSKVVAIQKPVRISFTYVGVFPNKQLVLYLGVTPTAALTSLHQRTHDVSSHYSPELQSFTVPDHFVLHSTLAIGLSPSDVETALHILGDLQFPIESFASEIRLVEYPTGTTLHTFPLMAD